MTASVPGAAGYKSVDEDGTDMNAETLTRIGAACLLLGLGWLLVGGALTLFGTVPALGVGYGVASAFTAGTLALAAGSPPGDTPREAALGAGGALAGVAWLLVGVGAYYLAGTLLPAAVGAVLLICGVSVFAYYDSDERAVDDWERDRPER
jgi:hypothetical protein